LPLSPRVYQHRDPGSRPVVEEHRDLVEGFAVDVRNGGIIGWITHGHHQHGLLMGGPVKQFPQEPHW